jgi:hypothetical protein
MLLLVSKDLGVDRLIRPCHACRAGRSSSHAPQNRRVMPGYVVMMGQRIDC